MTDELWLYIWQGQEIWHFTEKTSRPALGPHLPIPVVLEAPSPGINRKDREDDHSASSAEVKNEWRCNFTPSYAFVACIGTGDLQNTGLDKSADG